MANSIYRDTKVKKNLEGYFKKYINTMNVSDSYKPLLVDILMRRADTYELSPEDIRQDVVSLLYNLNEISIDNMPEGYENAAGLYMPATKQILLAKGYTDYAKDDFLYETLTHEVYHALSKDEYGRDRLGGYNTITGVYNSSLLEAIVEKSSYRTVFGNNKQNSPYFNNSAEGYSDVTFIVDAIEATYGVSEKDFLKNAIMGRERLASFLASRSGERPDSAYRFLDELEISYSQLHQTVYPLGKDEQTPYQKSLNISNALSGIYNTCERKMSERIMNTKVQSYEEVYNFNDSLKYNHNKLSAIMNDRIEYFSNAYDPNIKNIVAYRTNSNRNKTLFKVNDIENLVQSAPNFSDEKNFMKAYDWAKQGKISDLPPQCKAYYKIPNTFKENMPITQEVVNKQFEDEKFGPQYNNLKAKLMIKAAKLRENNILKSGIDKIKNLFGRKNQRLLTDQNSTTNNYQSKNAGQFTIFHTLTKEEQEMYNSQVKQAVDSLGKSQTTEEIDRDIEEK